MTIHHKGLTPEGLERARTKAMLLGFECRVVGPSTGEIAGVRWNSGSPLGRWEIDEEDAVVAFLAMCGFLVDMDGRLHQI